MLKGYFNAYTGTVPDYVQYDESNDLMIDDFHYKYETLLQRNNQDAKRLDNSGKYLLNICKESGLRILNGRSVGDLSGKPTCVTYNGCSVVDYTVVSYELLSSIGFFKVHEFTALSDHCPISCGVMDHCNSDLNNSSNLSPLPGKHIWTEQSVKSYKNNLQSPSI